MIGMKRWLMRMGERLARFMYGRYGNDTLNHVLFGTALVLMLLSCFAPLWWLVFPSWALLIWATFRCYSRNLIKRRGELEVWRRIWRPIGGFFALQGNKWRDRKTHRYFKCRKCKVVLRVPKGKGMIDVTCPKCRTVTVKKT